MKNASNYKFVNDFYESPLVLRGGINVIQAGRYYCRPGEVIPSHYHDDYFELSVVTDGQGTFITNNQKTKVQKNDVYVSFPYDKHEILSSAEDPLKYDNLAFTWKKTPYKEQLESLQEYQDSNIRIIHDQQINQFIGLLLNELAAKQDFYKDNLRNIILNVIVYTIRKFQEKKTTLPEEAKPNAQMFCARIMNFIDVNIYEMRSFNEITKFTNYNYSYTSTLFKNTTGTTIRQYVLNKKMEIAYLLLQEGKMKIFEIAEKLHYSDANAFSKAYKQKYGVSPKTHCKKPSLN